MTEPSSQSRRQPPARVPPTGLGVSEPEPDGAPTEVRLGDRLLGDLGNAVVDTAVLRALLAKGGTVATWLRSRGIDTQTLDDHFPLRGG